MRSRTTLLSARANSLPDSGRWGRDQWRRERRHGRRWWRRIRGPARTPRRRRRGIGSAFGGGSCRSRRLGWRRGSRARARGSCPLGRPRAVSPPTAPTTPCPTRPTASGTSGAHRDRRRTWVGSTNGATKPARRLPVRWPKRPRRIQRLEEQPSTSLRAQNSKGIASYVRMVRIGRSSG